MRRVRVRGGNSKFRALRLDHGNFSWGSEVGGAACWAAAFGWAALQCVPLMMWMQRQLRECPPGHMRRRRRGGAFRRRRAPAARAPPPAAAPPAAVTPLTPSACAPPLPPLLPLQAVTRKVRVLDVSYNASNNELVRTQTLVKGAIIQIDAAPFKQWYQQHYGVEVGLKKKGGAAAAAADGEAAASQSNHLKRKLKQRGQGRKLDQLLDDQFATGRLYASIASRPGQCGRADGYILEGRELEFYLRKMLKKKVRNAFGGRFRLPLPSSTAAKRSIDSILLPRLPACLQGKSG